MEILGLHQLQNLKNLLLHSNQITEIKGLDDLQNLRELNLINNRITHKKVIRMKTH